MAWRYDRRTDRFRGHDWPGTVSSGLPAWELLELEVGARAALALEDPEQAWWELIGNRLIEA